MKTKFDELVKQSINDFCKTISEATYQYVDKETKKPTEVPASHYKKVFSATMEETVDAAVQMQFLGIMYKQLEALKSENPELFTKALVMIDLGIKPKDIGVKEQIALNCFDREYERINNERKRLKQPIYITNFEYINAFNLLMSNKELQGQILEENESGIVKNEETDKTRYFRIRTSDKYIEEYQTKDDFIDAVMEARSKAVENGNVFIRDEESMKQDINNTKDMMSDEIDGFRFWKMTTGPIEKYGIKEGTIHKAETKENDFQLKS